MNLQFNKWYSIDDPELHIYTLDNNILVNDVPEGCCYICTGSVIVGEDNLYFEADFAMKAISDVYTDDEKCKAVYFRIKKERMTHSAR